MNSKILGFVALPLVLTLAAGFTHPVSTNTTDFDAYSLANKGQKKPTNTTNSNQMTQPSGDAMSNDQMTQPGGDAMSNDQMTQPGGDAMSNDQMSQPSGGAMSNDRMKK